MKIHEFQAKQILRDAGVAVLRGKVATTADGLREVGRSENEVFGETDDDRRQECDENWQSLCERGHEKEPSDER